MAICIAIPVPITAQLIIKLFDPELHEPAIASLYLPGRRTGMLWQSYSHRVDKVDFDVYRQRRSRLDALRGITSVCPA